MHLKALIAGIWIVLLTIPVTAQDVGSVTGRQLPRFVSIKREPANARRGPDRSHRIDWVYRRAGLPVQIIAEHGHWRKIVDAEGQGGWMYYTLLSGRRSALMQEPYLLRRTPSQDAEGTAQFESGVVASILECAPAWCRLEKDGHRGWAPKAVFWGATEEEVFK